jgi:hypothetical protein
MFHPQQPDNSFQSSSVRRADTGKTPAPAPNGHLTPATGPATGPAWDITTTARRRAAAIAAAIPGTTVNRTGPGQWRTRIPRPALAVTATRADAATLTVTLDDAPAAGPVTLTFRPWTAADVMPPVPIELPAPGHLTIRDIRISTLMDRTIRYLMPAFTTNDAEGTATAPPHP